MSLDTDTHTQKALFRPLPNGISAYELWQVQKHKLSLRQEYLDHWNSTATLTGMGRPVDAIISPLAPYVAPPHGHNKYVYYSRTTVPPNNFPPRNKISRIHDGMECSRLPRTYHPDWISRG